MPSTSKVRIYVEFFLPFNIILWGSDSSTVSSLIFVVSSSFHFGRDREWNFCRNADFSTLIHPFLLLHHITLFPQVPQSSIISVGFLFNVSVVNIQMWRKPMRFCPGVVPALGYGAGDRGQDPCVCVSFDSWINNFPPALCHQCHAKQWYGRQSLALAEGVIRINFKRRHPDIIIGKTAAWMNWNQRNG